MACLDYYLRFAKNYGFANQLGNYLDLWSKYCFGLKSFSFGTKNCYSLEWCCWGQEGQRLQQCFEQVWPNHFAALRSLHSLTLHYCLEAEILSWTSGLIELSKGWKSIAPGPVPYSLQAHFNSRVVVSTDSLLVEEKFELQDSLFGQLRTLRSTFVEKLLDSRLADAGFVKLDSNQWDY